MSTPTNVGDNPNDKMPAGTPLHPDKIVPEDDAGSAAIREEVEDEDNTPHGPDDDEDQTGLPAEPAL